MVQNMGESVEELSISEMKDLAEDLYVISERLGRVEPLCVALDGEELPSGYPVEYPVETLWHDTDRLISELAAVFRDGKHIGTKVKWVHSKRNGGKNG